MGLVDAVELAGDVLPRRWLRVVFGLLLIGMLVTGSTAPLLWYVTAKSEAIQEDHVAPTLDHIAELATPSPTGTGAP